MFIVWTSTDRTYEMKKVSGNNDLCHYRRTENPPCRETGKGEVLMMLSKQPDCVYQAIPAYEFS